MVSLFSMLILFTLGMYGAWVKDDLLCSAFSDLNICEVDNEQT